ncbi:2Fe-2S iron-sulfur cluster-binding protein [Halogranum rubrum]|uniref:Ferredoxin n=1 Tax=Halogranum salarium B-1 TaxID=1210908 RepID=J3JI82_9EURY|nr:2Fe-2S iron-sulfur cluster-binding protein [Halogranum salarium]EJN61649.1 ferredoxin [Halogranum salarium B-1]
MSDATVRAMDDPDRSDKPTDDPQLTVTVRHDGTETTLETSPGTNLRELLLERGLSPYTTVTERLNCGGRGLCATCGVRVRAGPDPTHWHDELAERFGYPRLSCQITVETDLVVELVEDKRVWGGRE